MNENDQINRWGESHVRPSHAKTFHDPNYSWSKDSRSESFNESTRNLEFVWDQFQLHPELDSSRIRVSYKDGCVHLEGSVKNLEQKYLAEKFARTSSHVLEVVNDLKEGQ
jgi:osmotically-inducible protein OsmY